LIDTAIPDIAVFSTSTRFPVISYCGSFNIS
jgi:hypothetical protein